MNSSHKVLRITSQSSSHAKPCLSQKVVSISSQRRPLGTMNHCSTFSHYFSAFTANCLRALACVSKSLQRKNVGGCWPADANQLIAKAFDREEIFPRIGDKTKLIHMLSMPTQCLFTSKIYDMRPNLQSLTVLTIMTHLRASYGRVLGSCRYWFSTSWK